MTNASTETKPKAAYTPGPWIAAGRVKAVGEDNHWIGQVSPARDHTTPFRGPICDLQSCDHINGITCEEAEANAHPTAAAPDLLHALIQCRSALGTARDSLTDPLAKEIIQRRMDAATAAISKARGAGQ